MSHAATEKKLQELIGRFEEQEKALPGAGSYQVEVLSSLLNSVRNWGTLTPRQLEFAKNLESQLLSLEELSDWKETFLTKYKEKFRYIVRWYSEEKLPYHSNTVLSALENEDYIPSKRDYDKLVNNKYSTRVIEEMLEKKAKYAAGDIIQMRDTYTRRQVNGAAYHNAYFGESPIGGFWKEPERNWCYIVVDNDLMPKNPCIGGRRYRLLPFGDGTLITTEERYIKKARV